MACDGWTMKHALAWLALVVGVTWFWNHVPMTLYGKHTAGQVVDAATGRAIAGAHVALLWRSNTAPNAIMGESGRTVCYHAAAAVTDVHGTFDIAAWREISSYRVYIVNPVVLVYAPSYVPIQDVVGAEEHGPPTAHLNKRIALKPFYGSAEERIEMLFGGLANQDCMYGKASQKSLYPMLRAIYGEARAIAETEDQRSTVRNIAYLAATSALAIDPNTSGNDAGIAAFIREQMK